MNRSDMKKTLLQVLWDIKRNVQPGERRGLCALVEDAFWSECKDLYDATELQVWRRILTSSMHKWPEYSGQECYPVPAPCWWSARGNCDLFDFDFERRTSDAGLIFWSNVPKWSGEYGSTRMRYLNHCIRYLEAQQ